MTSSPAERLYYTDAYCAAFDAVVTFARPHEGGWLVGLDRTAFYPASGGQPHDTGTLAGARVVAVLEQEDGAIAHLLDRSLPVGEKVRGVIDWPRRFDHMQQHTGQHLLSAAFDRMFGARTVGFHLGGTSSTIDLDRELLPASIAEAELAANGVVWEDRAVSVRFADEEEAAQMSLRKEPARGGVLRLIDAGGFDLAACGGTHVARTGAIGVIAVASWERFKGGVRVEFVCGGRALHAYRTLRDTVAGSIRLLSVLPEELPGAIEKLQIETKGLRKAGQALQEQLAVHQAAGPLRQGVRLGSATLVAEALPGWDAAGLKVLASTITSAPAAIAVLVSADAPVLIVVARSQDVPMDAGAVLRGVTERFGGRGGGKPGLAQGGGLTGSAADVLAAAREMVGAALGAS